MSRHAIGMACSLGSTLTLALGVTWFGWERGGVYWLGCVAILVVVLKATRWPR